jgi:hypothetical protein
MMTDIQHVFWFENHVAIRFVEGKMVPRKGPFTLHVPRNGWPGRILAATCETRSKMPPATYVFLPNPTLPSEVMTLVLEAERRIHAEYEKYFAHRIDLRDGVEQTSSVRESTSRSGPQNQPAHIAAKFGRFVVDEPICCLEARALLYGIAYIARATVRTPHLSNMMRSSKNHITCFIDNSTLLGALAKTWSKNYHINVVLRNIQQEMARVEDVLKFTFEYVP